MPGSTAVTNSADIAFFNAAIANTWWNTTLNPIGIDSATQNIGGIHFTLAAGNYFIGTTAGNTLKLSNSGAIQILSGLRATNAIQTINAPLQLQGTAYTFANDSANGSGAGAGTLNFGGGITGLSGAAVLTLNGSNTNANTIRGVIANGAATSVSLSKAGTGTWALSAANTCTGSTTINKGILEVLTDGSITHAASNITVGRGAGDNGTLKISGGSVSNAVGYIGLNAGSSGTATVSSGTWTNSSNLYVGNSGTGVLNITGNGEVFVGGAAGTGTLTLGVNATGNGTLNMGTGSTAGTLNAAIVTGGSGTGVVNFNHTGNLSFAPKLQSNLSVNKSGMGTTTLSGVNTYSGTTNNTGGTLRLGSNSALPGSAAISLSGKLETGGFNASTGALSQTAGVIDFGSGAVSSLTFASAATSLGGLSVWNWTGTVNTAGSASTDRLLFTSTAGVSGLSTVSFYTGSGTGPIGSGPAFVGNELVPVPEPGAAVAAGLLALGILRRETGRRRPVETA